MQKKSMALAGAVALAGSLLAGCGSAGGAPAQGGQSSANANTGHEITLTAISAWPKTTEDNYGLFDLIKQVNALGKGVVQIKYLGGPEVIPTLQQINALKNGTVDIDWTAANYTSSLVPAANAIRLSTLTPEQESQQGITKLWDEIYKPINVKFLMRGDGSPNIHFYLYTNKPIQSLSDFKGLQIRTTPAYQAFVSALGAAPVSIDPSEVYTSLQRHVVDGYGWPGYGIDTFGWDKYTKYMIQPGFYQVDSVGLMNLQKWNSLPKNVQQIFEQAEQKVEQDEQNYFTNLMQNEQSRLQKEGVEVIQLQGDTAKQYVQLAYSSAWQAVLKADPTMGATIKKALGQ